jgi:hypothetical protein
MAVLLLGPLTFGAYAQQTAQPKPATAAPAKATKPATSPVAKKPATAPAAAATPAKAASGPGAKVVLRVGNNEVTQADLDSILSKLDSQVQQSLSRQGKRPFGERYAMMLILSGQAVSHHLDSSPEFQHQLALQRMQMLAQAEYDVLASQAAVTPEDAGKYFTEHQDEFEEAKVRQVVIRKKAEGAPADAPGLPVADARARAEEIRKALTSGAEANKVVKDFAVPNVIVIDAEPRPVRRGQLLADLDKAVFQLKEGEISELVETPQVFVMVQAISHQRPELKDVSREIENKLRQQKLEATLADLRQKNPVWMDDGYFAAPVAPATTTLPPAPDPNPQPQQ